MVFGSRFAKGAQVEGSEWLKSSVSRLGNAFVQLLFRAPCSDLTNSFKAYRKEVINELNITSDGYDISMEIALKAIRRNYSCIMVPISWKQRELGQSKMSIIRAIPRFLNTALRTRFTSLN
jgi:dolichol-phosphate mannosyltransferase